MQEPVAAPFELLGGVGRVFHLELDGRLGSRNVVGPVVGAEAGLGRLLEGPQAEVLDALDLLAVQVAVAVFELEAEGVDVEPAGGVLVGDDGSEAGDEENVHPSPVRPSVSRPIPPSAAR